MTRIRLTHTKKKILNLFSFHSFYFLLLFIFHFLLAFNDFYVFHGSSTQSYSSYHYYLGWLWSLFLISEYDCILQRQKFWKYVIGVVLKLKPPILVEFDTISEADVDVDLVVICATDFETHFKEFETRLEEWESIQSKILTWLLIPLLPLLTVSSHALELPKLLRTSWPILQLYQWLYFGIPHWIKVLPSMTRTRSIYL